MASIEDYIKNIYSMYETGGGTNWLSANIPGNIVKYMKIPMYHDTFELPLLAILQFSKRFPDFIIRDSQLDESIAVKLDYRGAISKYKSVNRILQDALMISRTKGVMVLKTGEGSDEATYYVAHGAIFDASFNPVMLCSYNIELKDMMGGVKKYSFKNPILRITPSCYCNVIDAVQKFIVKKMPCAVLNELGNYPKLIVDEIPFKLKSVSPPTISTDSKDLLKTVSDNIEDIFT